jgi:hypothetical protein
MNLEILSFEEALKYEPQDKSYAIQIGGEFDYLKINPLKENKNWIKINNYYFDDMWPKDWKEYSWIDTEDPYFSGALSITWEETNKKFPNMTKESLMSYIESKGWPEGRCTLFDEKRAKKILNDFEMVREDVKNVVISSSKGKHRPSAVGIAMNKIYGWGIKGLEKEFFDYRKYIYEIMVGVGRKK